jgi:predicted DNA-binding antitoxin AbrB/MazE fold protein
MTIPARYENGAFRPLEHVTIKEGTVVQVHVPVEASLAASGGPSKTFRFTACGLIATTSSTV